MSETVREAEATFRSQSALSMRFATSSGSSALLVTRLKGLETGFENALAGVSSNRLTLGEKLFKPFKQ
jgi:hypothetical protein